MYHKNGTYNNGASTSKGSGAYSDYGATRFGSSSRGILVVVLLPLEVDEAIPIGGGGGYSGSNFASGGSYNARKNFLLCEYCGCKEHSQNQCYKIGGYLVDSSLRGSLCVLIKLRLGERLEALTIRALKSQIHDHILELSSLRINTIKYSNCCPNLVVTM
ncbi:hypothetical protein KY285_026784 [Solanum tuberosum]|nr:hypothetical protein KY285_026784 [Solanum tuberosum]